MKNYDCVVIGDLQAGCGHPPLFMAEISTFFNKDLEKAEALLDYAVKGGADIFKTEILHNPDVCLKNTGLVHTYNHANGEHHEDYRELIERKTVSLKDYARLFSLCREKGIHFVASVYDFEGVDFLVQEGAVGIKIARDNVNNVPLIRYCARTELPVIIDVAHNYLEEIALAVNIVKTQGNAGVIIQHHPGMNPAPPEIHNLRILETYRKIFSVPVGLSCHCRGDEMIYPAIMMGADIIEKGIFDDVDAVEQDIVSALDVCEIDRVVRKMKNCWVSIGDGAIHVNEPRDKSTWKGLVAKRGIKKGERLDETNLGFAWPPDGISVSFWDIVRGKRANQDIEKSHIISWEMLNS